MVWQQWNYMACICGLPLTICTLSISYFLYKALILADIDHSKSDGLCGRYFVFEPTRSHFCRISEWNMDDQINRILQSTSIYPSLSTTRLRHVWKWNWSIIAPTDFCRIGTLSSFHEYFFHVLPRNTLIHAGLCRKEKARQASRSLIEHHHIRSIHDHFHFCGSVCE